MPKGGKGVKGSKQPLAVEDEIPLSAQDPQPKPAPKPKKRVAPVVDAADGEEETVGFGTMEKIPEKPKQKRPRQTKKIDTSEIPAGKIELAGDLLATASASESEE